MLDYKCISMHVCKCMCMYVYVCSQTQAPLCTYTHIPAASVTMIDCIGNNRSGRVVLLPLFMGLVYFNSAHELKK